MKKNMKRVGLYETMEFRTKEELIKGIEARISKIKDSYTDEEKTTPKCKEYYKFLDKFMEKANRMILPKLLDEEWSYSFGISNLCAAVSLTKAVMKSETETEIKASYTLIRIESRLLPSSEYAKLHGVTDTTVRQWIRRGKLRMANKYGNTWRIPEFVEANKGQYINVLMGWNSILTDILPEYDFINEYDEVQIQQINKDKYKVWFGNNKTRKYMIKEMDRKERERFELMMISNPFVDLFDLPLINIEVYEVQWNK